MALVRFGNGVSEIRGSIAGNVFSRSHAGAIIRNRIVPVNPQTQAQTDIRNLFSTVAQLYTDLTPAQRQAWDDYAQLVVKNNVFGDAYTPTGRQMFQECNMNIALTTTVLTDSPGGGPTYAFAFTPLLGPAMDYYVKPAPPSFDGDDKSMILTLAAGAVTAFGSNENFIPPNATDDIQVFLTEATDLMRPTIRNRARRFKFLGTSGGSIAAPLDIAAPWNTVFGGGTYQAGQTCQVKLSVVNKGGLRSDRVLTQAVAA